MGSVIHFLLKSLLKRNAPITAPMGPATALPIISPNIMPKQEAPPLFLSVSELLLAGGELSGGVLAAGVELAGGGLVSADSGCDISRFISSNLCVLSRRLLVK